MSTISRITAICLTAAMLFVQPFFTGWVAECGCQTSKSLGCSKADSSCCCCLVEPDNLTKHCPHCQGSNDDPQLPVAGQIACHCGDSSPVPTPPQSMPESSGLDSLNWMVGDVIFSVTAPRLRISQAHSQESAIEASVPNFKQVAYCVWLI
jgi:hypothetical protein